MSMKTWYIIPARKDSKGIKFKNRKLFNYTALIFRTGSVQMSLLPVMMTIS